ncbi:hypothetical protein SDC9_148679 [bioreactor metagenome]|uniref:Uncharacterized protein n=1 Tax=bioreactor metagenome TaxID=1076179 RepID=A0A645EJG6_9ZZZZ
MGIRGAFPHDVAIAGVRVQDDEGHHLFHIVEAGDSAGSGAGLVQGGQQHRREDCDDRNYNQEFNQGKILFHPCSLSFRP